MPFLRATRRQADERLLWSRDIRFVHRLAARLSEAHVLELDSGTVLIASAERLTDAAAAEVAASSGAAHPPEYGLVPVDATLPEGDRYLIAMSSAVQVSGLAERILRNYDLSPLDSALVVSSSGCNLVPIEIAGEFQRRGVRVVSMATVSPASVATAQPARGVWVTITSSGPTETALPPETAPSSGTGMVTVPPASTAAATSAAGMAAIAAATTGVSRPNRRPSARKFGLTT
jgi:hypothetical protein